MQVFDLGLYGTPRQATLCHMKILQKQKWLDHATKEVNIRAVVYNGHLEIYSEVKLRFEFTRGGRIIKFLDLKSNQIRDMYTTPRDMFRLFLELNFLAFVVYFTLTAVKQTIRVGFLKYLGEGGFIVLVGTLVNYANVLIWVLIATSTATFKLDDKPELDHYAGAFDEMSLSFEKIQSYYQLYQISNMASILLNILRSFYYLR